MEPIPNSLQLDKNHPESSAKFQQNSNLAAALEKLYKHSIQNKMIANNNEKELLPNRKLDFHEVRKLLNEQISPSGSNLGNRVKLFHSTIVFKITIGLILLRNHFF